VTLRSEGKIMNADESLTHECPGPGCTHQVDSSVLMCPGCWYQVPKPIRTAVWRAWRRGAGSGTPAHRAAMTAAIAAVNRKNGE
jgi:hypothetical protein